MSNVEQENNPIITQNDVAFPARFKKAMDKVGGTVELRCEKLGISRGTYYHWIDGKHLPKEKERKRICEILNLDERYFDPDYPYEKFLDEYYPIMDKNANQNIKKLGIDRNLYEFIRKNPAYSDAMLKICRINRKIQSLDQTDPASNSGLQFVTSDNRKYYLDDSAYTALRAIQKDVEDYISDLLFKYAGIRDRCEMQQRDNSSNDSENRKESFAGLMKKHISGMDGLTIDEYSLVSIIRHLFHPGEEKELIKALKDCRRSMDKKGGRGNEQTGKR